MGSGVTPVDNGVLGTPHESTEFSPNFMVYGRELFMPVDVMLGRPEGSEEEDELDYVREL